jgi:hypothetical protein
MCENQKGTFHDLAYQRGNTTPNLFIDRDTADCGKRDPTGIEIQVFFGREESL